MKLPEYWIHFPAIAHSSSLLSNLLLHLMGKEEHPLLLPLLHCHRGPCRRHSRIINEWLLYTWIGGHAQIPSCQMLQHNIYLHKHNKGASVLVYLKEMDNNRTLAWHNLHLSREWMEWIPARNPSDKGFDFPMMGWYELHHYHPTSPLSSLSSPTLSCVQWPVLQFFCWTPIPPTDLLLSYWQRHEQESLEGDTSNSKGVL